MKRIAKIAIATLLFETTFSLRLFAQDRNDAYDVITDTTCINVIHQVHSDIENRIGGAVGDVTYYDPSQQTPDSPYEKATLEFCRQSPSGRCK